MTYRWQVTIEAWPHSTGNGQSNDQKAAGDRTRVFEVDADCMHAAFKLAEAISWGIRSHPAVWQAPIIAIERVKP